MREADLARWTEEVLVCLLGVTDAEGRKVYLSPENKRLILDNASHAVTSMEADMKPGGAFYEYMKRLAE